MCRSAALARIGHNNLVRHCRPRSAGCAGRKLLAKELIHKDDARGGMQARPLALLCVLGAAGRAVGFAPAAHPGCNRLPSPAFACPPTRAHVAAAWARGGSRQSRLRATMPESEDAAAGTGAADATGAAEEGSIGQEAEEGSIGQELKRLSRSGKDFLTDTSWILKLGDAQSAHAR